MSTQLTVGKAVPIVKSAQSVDIPAQQRAILSAEMRAYLMERRRALLTELDSLNKLLGLTTK